MMLEGAMHNAQRKPCKRGLLGQIPYQNHDKKGMQARLVVFDPKFSRHDAHSKTNKQT
jgi:hypothetical protein